jgi:tricarballylate dehydrogenase
MTIGTAFGRIAGEQAAKAVQAQKQGAIHAHP